MSDKDLQRLTDSVSDIGQPTSRRSFPSHRTHITKKVRIADQRTLYISVHEDPYPAEIFRRVKGADCTPETITLYDVIARLMSVDLQYGAFLEKLGDLFTGAQFGPCGPVSGHDRPSIALSLAYGYPYRYPYRFTGAPSACVHLSGTPHG